MRRLVIILLVFQSLAGLAQPFGDEWVNFDKEYWRIPVAEDGIYRINYNDLLSAGFPVNTLDPRRIQLFHQGIEQSVFIEGQGDASFDPSDYLLFAGKRNDGTLDAELYRPASFQPHDLYSIYTDTAAYYLTFALSPLDRGRRMDAYSENNTGGLPAEPSSVSIATLIRTDSYAPGVFQDGSGVLNYTWFDQGEGWSGRVFQEGQNDLNVLNGLSLVIPGSNPTLEVLLQGRDNLTHVAEIYVGPNPSSLRNIGSVNFTDYESQLFTSNLNASDISTSGELFVDIRCIGLPGQNDLISTSYLRVFYVQQTNMQSEVEKEFRITASSGTKAYIDINNVSPGAQLFDISDADNPIIVGFNTVGNNINAIIRNAGSQRTLLLTSNERPVSIQSVKFRDFDYDRADHIIITHSLLRQPALGYDDPVRAIASYRASAEGGGYDTLTVDMRTLYDQFSYGVTTPLAIYNFMRRFIQQGEPRYLFLIGKGLEPQHDFYRNPQGYFDVEKNGVSYQIRDLVPPAGNPGADVTFTAGLDGTIYEPAVPTGRIPAVSSEQVAAYFEKMREMESQPYNDLYRKTVLHLSGGITPGELILFRQYMDGFGEIAVDPFYGGTYNTIQKDNTNVVELINISEEVNDGVALVTFYGHSAPAVTDIDIGFVTDPALGYNNLNKYPMFLVNGCQAGQFFLPDVIFGEDWINARDLGATGFIAHSSFGAASALRRYSTFFYETAFEDSVFINKPIGDIHKETAFTYQTNSAISSPITITQVQQMVLLGDPATPLFNAMHPDYQTADNQLLLSTPDGTPITSQSPELQLNIISKNFGRTHPDSLEVGLTRTLENGTILQYDSIFLPVYFQDTLKLIIPNASVAGAGTNEFFVQLDPLGKIDELNENNNQATLNFFIPSFSTQNLFPVNYALTADRQITLTTQSTDFFGSDRSYSFEIDTIAAFSSEAKISGTVSGGRIASFVPGSLPGIAADSITYYWRTKYTQPSENESDEWQVSSFSIVEGSPEGWTQRDFGQFEMNEIDGLQAVGNRFEFETTETPLSIFTAGSNNPLTNEEVSVNIDNVEYNIQGQYCRDNTLNFMAFNRNTSVPYLGLVLSVLDSRTCGRQPQVINSFSGSQINASSLGVVDYIAAIPDGDIVTVFTIGLVSYSSFSAGVETALSEIGVDQADINAWINGEPIIIIGRKGAAPGTASVMRTIQLPPQDQELSQDSLITGSGERGTMYSPVVGPVSDWQQLDLFVEKSSGDQFTFDVEGITLDGTTSIIFSNETSASLDLTAVDAEQYPFLRLRGNFEDTQNRTAPQLKWWQISYAGVPEGILVPASVNRPIVNLPEGTVLENVFDFVNISGLAFSDSLEFEYRLFNPSQQKVQQATGRIAAPLPGDSTRFTITTETFGFAGLNDYSVKVNPEILPELYYNNNRYDEAAYLQVVSDNIDPVIDVVFDGSYIIDGEIISPEPLISIKIVDDNDVVLKQDTTGIELRIRENCDGCVFERIPFSSPFVEWFPATAEDPFRIEYQSPTLGDGMYTFSVQASDGTGNPAGEEPYQVTFEVINESTITNFYPYPNPFSTSTRFVFTLTGTYVPEGIKIQILTVTGRVVREITTEELGSIRIGNNITEYAWDGRDEFGDRLANGVYLYRVILDTGSNSIEHRATAGDKGFDKGFGKLYILR